MDTNSSKDEPFCEKDQQTFRRKAARLQFFQSVFQGIGGASLFGLISSLILGGGAVAATLPIWALAVIPIFGVTMIFIGTRCGIESQLLSQTLGAKMMGNAVKPNLTPEIGRENGKVLPPGMDEYPEKSEDRAAARERAEAAHPDRPRTRIHDAVALDKVQGNEQALTIH